MTVAAGAAARAAGSTTAGTAGTAGRAGSRPGTRAANARVSGKRPEAGAFAGASDAKLAERGNYWRAQGLSDGQVRHELQREGFAADKIGKWLRGEPLTEPKPAPAKSAEPKTPASAGPSSSSTSRGSGGSSFLRGGGDAGGLLVAVVAYPLMLAYLREGGDGVRRWLRAKFLNQTTTDSGQAGNVAFGLRGGTSGGGSVAAAPAGYRVTKPSGPKPKIIGGGKKGGTTGPMPKGSPVVEAVSFARAQIGKPYRWGGTGPNSWDCSGLIQAAYRSGGVRLPRTSYQMLTVGRHVAKKDLQVGDLVWPKLGHVQLYIGGGRVIEAPRTGLNVREAPLGAVYAARRVA